MINLEDGNFNTLMEINEEWRKKDLKKIPLKAVLMSPQRKKTLTLKRYIGKTNSIREETPLSILISEK
jgi:hypothetical protein